MDNTVTTIDDLLQRLEYMQEMDQVNELECLKAEKLRLLQEVEVYWQALDETNSFASKTAETLSLLQSVAQTDSKKVAAGDKKWLAYWGIIEGDETEAAYCGKTQSTLQLSNTTDGQAWLNGTRTKRMGVWGVVGQPAADP